SEKALLERAAGRLRADLLIVPHHGSRTSSTPGFIQAVGASRVIFPVGYRNHFGHPKPDVVGRYRQSGARMYRTDLEGALTVNLAAPGLSVTAERNESQRYWHSR
ncbi:MAG: competence protein ComEC, partial [Sterolibacterium sp.]